MNRRNFVFGGFISSLLGIKYEAQGKDENILCKGSHVPDMNFVNCYEIGNIALKEHFRPVPCLKCRTIFAYKPTEDDLQKVTNPGIGAYQLNKD